MKTNWPTKKLSEICDKASSNISQNQLKDEDGRYPIYGAGGFIKNISFYHQNKEYISIIKDGAGIGRISLLPAKSSVIGTLQYLIPKENINIKFLYYILNSFDFQKYKNGATIPHIYFREYSEEQFLIPPLIEQHRIVKILDEVFDKIAKAKENNEKNLQNQKELFESYLQNVFAKPSKDWQRNKLEEICEIKHGFAFIGSQFKNNLNDNDPIVLTPGNFKEGGGLYFNTKNTKRLRGKYPEEFLFKKGDLVIVMTDLSSKMKILGNSTFIENGNILHNQRIGKVIFKNNTLDKNFLHFYFQTQYFRDSIKQTATGTMVKHTAPKRILDNKISFPKSLSKQKDIVKKLDALSTETKKLEAIYKQKLADLEELKKSILNKAFNGEL